MIVLLMEQQSSDEICPLCGRPLAQPMNRHHLVPLSKGGKGTPTLTMHKICHNKIHAVLTEKELLSHYNTIERLQSHEEIAKFIKWVRKKPPEFYDGSVKMKR
jgi:5-methylcytosine-specific restriction endonuclease McrA